MTLRLRRGSIRAAVGLIVLIGAAPGTHGETIVGSAAASIGNFASERVLCPAGMVATGGGIDLANVLTMSVTSSAPVFDDGDDGQRLISTSDGSQPAPIGWQAAARNESSSDGLLKVASLCTAAPGTVAVVGSAVASIGNFASERVLCPAGMVATGGGIDLANVLTMTVTSSGPVFDDGDDGQRLISTPDGVQPAPIGWQAAARNESSADGTFKVAVICVPEPDTALLSVVAISALLAVGRSRLPRT